MTNLVDTGDKCCYLRFMNNASSGNWEVAANGTENEFTTRLGRRVVYMWQPSTGETAYLDLGSDVFLTDAEADAEI